MFCDFFFQGDEMGVEHLAVLERLRQTQRQDHLKGSVSGSVQATDRLMKELRDIYRSDSFKKGEKKQYSLSILLFFFTYSSKKMNKLIFAEFHLRRANKGSVSKSRKNYG